MKVIVDLNLCQDHGQCVFSAPQVFSLDSDGKLALRAETDGDTYISGELDEAWRDDIEEAADVCPMLAIEIED